MDAYSESSWHAAARGPTMVEFVGRVGVPRPLVVLAAAACARVALVHVPPQEPRPRRAIEVAEAWARGRASSVALAAAVDAAANANADGVPAQAAIRAAHAVGDAVIARWSRVSEAADSAVCAAEYAADACVVSFVRVGPHLGHPARLRVQEAVRSEALRHMAPLVRKHIPWADLAAYARRGVVR